MKPNTVFKRAYNRGLSRLPEFADRVRHWIGAVVVRGALVIRRPKTCTGVDHRFGGPDLLP